MITWVLVIFLQGVGTYHSVALATVPGFSTYETCHKAGEQIGSFDWVRVDVHSRVVCIPHQ